VSGRVVGWAAVSSPPITYVARLDATPKTELDMLASVYRFVLDCHAKKEAAPESRPDDARKDQDAGTYRHCT
jgi:hypothetical protein